MAIEIERKFLPATTDLSFLRKAPRIQITQGYLHEAGMTSRVRIAESQAYITLKGKAKGLARPEFEYPIPLEDAKELLINHTVGRLVSKIRHMVVFAGNTWEVDVFSGHLEGLVLIELELQSESQRIRIPPWVGEEVTGNKAFSNKNLATGKRSLLEPALMARNFLVPA